MKTLSQLRNNNLTQLIESCLASEEALKLSKRSLNELKKRFSQLSVFYTEKKIVNIQELTPTLFEDFIHTFDHRGEITFSHVPIGEKSPSINKERFGWKIMNWLNHVG